MPVFPPHYQEMDEKIAEKLKGVDPETSPELHFWSRLRAACIRVWHYILGV